MQYYGKELKKTSGLILLVISAILLISCCFGMNAEAATGKVDLVASDYSEGTHNGVHASDATTMLVKAGNALGYKVDFETPATSVTVELSTNSGAAGKIEVRLDSKTGPLLATMEAEKSGSWTKRTHTAKIDYEFSGQHTIWFCFVSGQADFHTISFWIPGANGGNYPAWPGVDTYTDISNSEYREEINMLKNMKAFGDGDDATEFRGKIAATRGEFAIAMANLFDVSSGTESSDIFTDIKRDDAFCSAVTELLHLNIVKADTSKFRPTDYITYDEAAKWMVAALGLEYQVNTKNLDKVIRDMHLFNDVDSSGKYVTREQMAKLLVNTIQAENAVITAFKPNDYYKFAEGDGVLSYQGIYRGRGIVEANGYYSMSSNTSAAAASDVIIDGQKFNAGKTNAPNYVGFEVDYLYQNTNAGKTLIGIISTENSSSVIFDSRDTDIAKITEELITYYPDETTYKEKKIKLDSDTIIFYNDKLIDRSLETLLGSTDGKDFDGTILLINNDGDDDDYEIVRIYHMESIIFGGFKGNSVHDILKDEYIPFDDMNDLLIYDNGSLAEITAIPYGSVIDVYRSKNTEGKQIFKGDISKESVEGYVSKIDSNGKVVLDNNVTYGLYKDFKETLTVGQEAKFLINSFGDILGIEKAGEDHLALLLESAINDPYGFDGGIPMVKVHNLADDTENVLYFADDVYLDGVRTNDANVIYGGGGGFSGISNTAKNSLIRYRVNEEGKITLMDTPKEVIGGPRDCVRSVTNGAGAYRSMQGMLFQGNNYYGICPVASDTYWVDLYTYMGMSKILTSVGQKTEGSDITLEGFSTMYDSNIANVIIRNRTGTTVGGDQTGAMIITDIVTRWEDDQEQIYITGLTGSSTAEYKVDKDTYNTDDNFKQRVDGAQKGDYILPFVFDGKTLMGLEYVFMGDGKDANELGVASILNTHTNFDLRNVEGHSRDKNGVNFHGTIIEREGNYIKVSLGKKDDPAAPTEWVRVNNAGIIVCEDNGRIYLVDNKQSNLYLGIGEHVLVTYARWSYAPSNVVVYRSIDFDN